MANKHPEYMTTSKERFSYWTYFIGQNVYYNITAAFISTYLAMQGVNLAKVAAVPPCLEEGFLRCVLSQRGVLEEHQAQAL